MNSWIFLFCCMHFATTKRTILPKVQFNHDGTLIVAHRGLRALHLENTLEALTSAFKAGADGVEFDVQLSRDLVPMVFHDRNLRRLTGIKKNIDDLTLSELRALRQRGDGYPTNYAIPTLEEVLMAMPEGKLINVELKETTGMRGKVGMDKVLTVLKPFKTRLKIIISSFEPKIVAMVHKADPDYSLGWLIDQKQTLPAYLQGASIINKVDYLHPHINLVNHKTSRYAKEHGVNLILWGHKRLGEEAAFMADGHTALISDVAEDLMREWR